MKFFLRTGFFLSLLLLSQLSFAFAAENKQFFLLDQNCKRVLIGPIASLENIKKNKIASLSGDSFCLKVSTGDTVNGKDYFIRITKDWLLNNQVVEVGGNDLLTANAKDRQNMVFSSTNGSEQPLVLQIKQSKGGKSLALKDFFQHNPVVTTGSVAVATVFSLATIANFLFNIHGFEQLRGTFINFLEIIFLWRKKHRVAGIVYDGITGKPISLATVSVVDQQGKIKETKTTDRNGAYFFLVAPGEYQLRILKEGYRVIQEHEEHLLTVKYKPSYFEGKILQLSGSDLLIKDAIALIKLGQSISLNSKVALFFENFSNSFFWEILFWTGFIFSSVILFFNPTAWNFLINAIYLISYLFQKANFHKINWGTIFDRNGAPVAFAMVKVFSENEGNNFIARAIADEKGRYALILDEGEYLLEINSSQDGSGESKKTGKLKIRLNKRKFVAEDIVLGN